jgi:adenosylmethionine-8-amino-7-oxononanoate aminotransferase
VITGFGRTGRWFALQHWGVQPDIVSVAKALTSAYVPMGAFIVSQEIMEALQDLPTDAASCTGTPTAPTPPPPPWACATSRSWRSEGLVDRAAVMGARLGDGLREALGGHAHVDNIRNLGLMAGLTLDAGRRPAARRTRPPPPSAHR